MYTSPIHISLSTYSDIAQKLTSMLDHILKDYTLVDAAYRIPERMASKVLAIATFLKIAGRFRLAAKAAGVISPRELNAIKFPGGKSFAEQLPDDVDADYVFILNDIENALQGFLWLGRISLNKKSNGVENMKRPFLV